ncbi:MAG: mechanosensitive ion channel [Anaerolineales bacterium]|nr:mechanosensitive ion channel [Anaerolineales bacterium]
MDLPAILNDLLSSPWIILGLAALLLFVAWILGGLLSRLVIHLADRVSFSMRVARFIRFSDPRPISLWIRRLTRWIVFLLGVVWAWQLCASNPEIVRFVENLRTAILGTFQLPVVIFFFDLALILLATILFVRIFGWIKRRFEGLAQIIESQRGKRLAGWRIQKLQLLSARQVTEFLLLATRYSRYAITLLLAMVYLMGIFSIFPQTRGIVSEGVNVLAEILTSGWLNFVDYLPNLLSLIVVMVMTYFGLRLVRFFFLEIEKGTISLAGFQLEWAKPTYSIIRILIIVLALIIAFPFLPGSSSPAFQGISIFIGALLSLGSTSVVGNIVAGIILTYVMAFRVGDRVQIGETVGDVIDKGLIATRVRTIKNVDTTIPNGIVLANHIINFSAVAKDRGLILHTTVTIGYDAPWRTVHETLIRAALSTPSILANPCPFILQTSLDNSYVSYELNAYTRDAQRMAVTYSELHQNIQDKFNEAKIEILSPQFSALRDGNAVTIPAEHRPANFHPPSFRVKIDKED